MPCINSYCTVRPTLLRQLRRQMRIVSWQQLSLQLIAVPFSRLLHLLSPTSSAAF